MDVKLGWLKRVCECDGDAVGGKTVVAVRVGAVCSAKEPVNEPASEPCRESDPKRALGARMRVLLSFNGAVGSTALVVAGAPPNSSSAAPS